MILNDEQQNLIQSAKKGFNLWVTLEDIIHAPLWCCLNPSFLQSQSFCKPLHDVQVWKYKLTLSKIDLTVSKNEFNLWVSLEDIIHAPSDVTWTRLFCRVNLSAWCTTSEIQIDTFKNRFYCRVEKLTSWNRRTGSRRKGSGLSQCCQHI